MGLLDKLFPKREKDFLTDDEREIREYEENEYRAESGVADNCHAEFIITSATPMSISGGVTVRGSVTEGTFKVGDAVVLNVRNGQCFENAIKAITVHSRLSETATEGQTAEFVLDPVDVKMIKRNDIIKKLIKE
ncbi:hypothetical protein [uncultured Ruminococcus sp.]|uniref:hypothetical protein n=1 Tax=uncultured Ruminococcus sp. TaxID=165186 RepID=UPI001569E172|nr:hypothetical protein [uncultured Ruminococcus sp.]